MDDPIPALLHCPALHARASTAGDVDRHARRSVILRGLAAIGTSALWGCSGASEPDVATPPRMTRQVRPQGGRQSDPRPLPPTREPIVRVLAERFPTSGLELRIESTQPWVRIRDDSDRGGAVLASPLVITSLGDRWRIESASAPAIRVPVGVLTLTSVGSRGEAGEISVASGPEAAPQPLGTTLALVPNRDEVDLVTHLPIERYLPGVLARELFGHWSIQAFRAQAVAARSFAVCEAAHWSGRRHYDLTRGGASQAWVGLVESGRAAESARETRGVLLTWDTKVVPGYYCSCCGGLPADASDAIGSNPANAIPPLAGRSDGGGCCESSPTWRWRRRLDLSGLSAGLALWARREQAVDLAEFDRLAAVEVSAVNRHGRPVRYRFEDVRGRTAELRGERARRALEAAAPEASDRFLSAAFEAEVASGHASFEGCGHGHGVGLCQYGAEAMGRRGVSHLEILGRYYPGSIPISCWG